VLGTVLAFLTLAVLPRIKPPTNSKE
jgi:hypothetical protein